jgi:GGDEF domain-containing protein
MRLSFSVVCVSWFLFLSWALPLGPFGMTLQSYDAAVAVGFVLGLTVINTSFGFWIVWRPMFRDESPLEFWRVLFGAQLLIRQPRQFQQRLELECRRARKSGEPFSLIVLHLAEPEVVSPRRRRRNGGWNVAALFVRGIARTEDIVADAGPDEVWLLALGADDEGRRTIVHRIARARDDQSGTTRALRSASIGSATFGPACDTAAACLATARAELDAAPALSGPQAAA